VVSGEFRDYIEVFRRIGALMKDNRPAVVAIDGGSAAGKTTLAALSADVYGAGVVHMDDFFLPPERKTPRRLAEPGGNVDYERFLAEAGQGLKSGGAFEYRAYNCKTGKLTPVRVSANPLRVVEGAYSLHPELIGLYDLKIFLRIEGKEQSRRILARNGAAMHRRFMEEWIPLEEAYFTALDIERRCDLVYRLPFAPAD
jgi:uridine kinase